MNVVDPNLLKLKNNLEKDSLVSPPKYGKPINPIEKGCDLVRSILKSKSGIIQHRKPSFEGRKSIHPQRSNDFISSHGAFSQADRNTSIGGKVSYTLGDEGIDSTDKKKPHPSLSLKYTYDTIILNPPLSKQADAILRYLSKRNKTNLSSQLMVKKWVRDFKLTRPENDKSEEHKQPPLIKKPFHFQRLEKVSKTIL